MAIFISLASPSKYGHDTLESFNFSSIEQKKEATDQLEYIEHICFPFLIEQKNESEPDK